MALSDKEIGMRVRNVRRENGLTQDKFARKFHMTQQTLSRYENGKYLFRMVLWKTLQREWMCR